ncbi:hypothetical protein SKTS_30300 [Sulfurimicrobium lacus]|uniref:Uncharacterized protein n=1 Tax=Sulfurimicrobium lacus TaxID=2715678 RepID=A0A6F8VEN5_9PROT|nr:hypothetical protein [Sulfurimicrobium lacus]BCB28144.1 hypothetical protein SKTS_30300 [Sulfurimicrobium lacus]
MSRIDPALEAAGIERRQYRYNTGPRIQEIDPSSPTAQPIKIAYRYTGFGRLAQHPDTETPAVTPQSLIRDPLGRLSQDTRYRYNSLDQRIANRITREDGILHPTCTGKSYT